MITNQDITKLKEVFATKDDLKNFATKDDLKNYPTKDDLKQALEKYATKDDLKTTTKDILDLITAFREELLKEMHERHNNLKKELKGDISDLKHDILSFKDDIITEIRTMRQELDITTGYRDKIDDHEDRINKLESHSN